MTLAEFTADALRDAAALRQLREMGGATIRAPRRGKRWEVTTTGPLLRAEGESIVEAINEVHAQWCAVKGETG